MRKEIFAMPFFSFLDKKREKGQNNSAERRFCRFRKKEETDLEMYPISPGFGFALSQNEAAMIRYAHLDEKARQAILERANNARSEKDLSSLVAALANGTVE